MKKFVTNLTNALNEADMAAKAAEDKKRAAAAKRKAAAAKKKPSPGAPSLGPKKKAASGDAQNISSAAVVDKTPEKDAPLSDPPPPTTPASALKSAFAFDKELIAASNGVWDTFTALKEVLPVALNFPELVVLGSESTGKSTLLERFLGLRFLPRAEGIVTLAPIEIRLVNAPKPALFTGHTANASDSNRQEMTADKVLDFVQGFFNSLDSSNIPGNGPSVFVELHGPDRPNLTLVDLPGLVSHPPSNLAATRALATRYLAKPETLVLCVVPATTPSLLSTPALELIHSHNKSGQTLLALTRADEVAPSQFRTRVVGPLIADAGDIAKEFGTYGLYATASLHMDTDKSGHKFDVAALTEAEQGMFNAALEASSDLSPADKDKVRARLGVTALQKGVISMYLNYVKCSWAPGAMRHLDEQAKKQIQSRLDALGEDVLAMPKSEREAWLGREIKTLLRAIGTSLYISERSLFADLVPGISEAPELDDLYSLFKDAARPERGHSSTLSAYAQREGQLKALHSALTTKKFAEVVMARCQYKGPLTRFPDVMDVVNTWILSQSSALAPDFDVINLDPWHGLRIPVPTRPLRDDFIGLVGRPLLHELARHCSDAGSKEFVRAHFDVTQVLDCDSRKQARADLLAQLDRIQSGREVLQAFLNK